MRLRQRVPLISHRLQRCEPSYQTLARVYNRILCQLLHQALLIAAVRCNRVFLLGASPLSVLADVLCTAKATRWAPASLTYAHRHTHKRIECGQGRVRRSSNANEFRVPCFDSYAKCAGNAETCTDERKICERNVIRTGSQGRKQANLRADFVVCATQSHHQNQNSIN